MEAKATGLGRRSFLAGGPWSSGELTRVALRPCISRGYDSADTFRGRTGVLRGGDFVEARAAQHAARQRAGVLAIFQHLHAVDEDVHDTN